MKTEKEIKYALKMFESRIKIKQEEINTLALENPFENTTNIDFAILILKKQIEVLKYVLDIK